MQLRSKQSRVVLLAMGVVLGACTNNSSSLNVTPTPTPAPTPFVQTNAPLSASATPYLSYVLKGNQYRWETVSELNGTIYALGYANGASYANFYNVTNSLAGSATAPSNVSAEDGECVKFISMDRVGPNNNTGAIIAATQGNLCYVNTGTTSLTSLSQSLSGSVYTGVYGGISGNQFAVSTSAGKIIFYTWNSTDNDVTMGKTITAASGLTFYGAQDGVWAYNDGEVSFLGTDGLPYVVDLSGILAFGVDGQGNAIAQTSSNKMVIIQGSLACGKDKFTGVCIVEHTLAEDVANVASLVGVLPVADSTGLYVIAGRDKMVDAVNLPSIKDAATAQGGVQASVTGVGTTIFGDAAAAVANSSKATFAPGFGVGQFLGFMPDGSVSTVTLSASK